MNISSKRGPGTSANEEEKGAELGVPGAGGGGSYIKDFADSTKSTAVISPPDPGNAPVFTFSPTVGGEFPDLADYEFLRPTLHVRSQASGMEQKEDLYQRIEHRLAGYRQQTTKAPISNGLEKDKLRRPSGFGKPSSAPSKAGLKTQLP